MCSKGRKTDIYKKRKYISKFTTEHKDSTSSEERWLGVPRGLWEGDKKRGGSGGEKGTEKKWFLTEGRGV